MNVPRDPTPWTPDPHSFWALLGLLPNFCQRYWAPNKVAATVTDEGWVVYNYDSQRLVSDRVSEGPESGMDGRIRADKAIETYMHEVKKRSGEKK